MAVEPARSAQSTHACTTRFAAACRGIVVAAALVTALVTATAPAVAQVPRVDVTSSSSYITPFPPADTYRVQVYGDWMAESLLPALAETLQTEPRVQVLRRARTLVPLVRFDHEDDVRAEEQSRDPLQIGVLFFGISDRTNFRSAPGAPLLRLGTEAWQAEYGRRVDRLLKALKRRGIAIYLVGQPPLRREEANTDAMMLSEVLRDKAFVNGVRFIDIHPAFVDEDGDYTQYGPDFSGDIQRLRESDGVSLSWIGNRKLAAMIDKEIRKDLAIAYAERAVPLAGTEAEQRRINPDKPYVAPQRASLAPQAQTPQKDGRGQAAAQPSTPPLSSPGRQPASITDQKSETSRLVLRIPDQTGREETVTTEIVRPPISAATLTLLKRKETAQVNSQTFDTIAAELSDGTTLSLFVAPGQNSDSQAKGTASPAQEIYNTVWIRGDRLPPKPGRADDFRWPPRDEIPYVAAPSIPDKGRQPAAQPAKAPAGLLRANPPTNIPRARLQSTN